MESLPVPRPQPTARRPQHLCLDKGYDYEAVRALAAVHGFRAHIRSRGEERQAKRQGSRRKARRRVVERTHAWFNRDRSLLVRWAKKEANYRACSTSPLVSSPINLLGYWDRL